MCGISGAVAFTEKGKSVLERIRAASAAMATRGPDHEGFYFVDNVALAHRRLSIIDTSAAAHQPMKTADGNHTIIFNGEFFNFQEHRSRLTNGGHRFVTSSDTEVLLTIFQQEGVSGLEKINGFFAFAVHDKRDRKLFLARDRMGVKPLYYYHDQDIFVFGSELKALLAAGIPKELDAYALSDYLHLNYIPGNQTILKGVKKLPPGHYAEIDLQDQNQFKLHPYYQVPKNYQYPERTITDYAKAKSALHDRLDGAVQRRLIADVPLGAFLSGGIDSSVVVGLASRHTRHLKTFSIGFRDEPHFDETRYAQVVADRFKTDHTVFSLTSDDLYENLFGVLNYFDEPFADSSALAVNILSMHTRKHVTVALSGDGADELLGGYNKHRAEWTLQHQPLLRSVVPAVSSLMKGLEGSRNNPLSNKLRQLHRFAEGANLHPAARYWRWCGFTGSGEVATLMKQSIETGQYEKHVQGLLKALGSGEDLNDTLYMDSVMVLPDDMLVKVDRMSMAHSLEVRSPFMDKEVVDFCFSIPADFKINATSQKRILKETFTDLLPAELLTRKKQGFEIPLLKWLRTGLSPLVHELVLDTAFIEAQGIFNPAALSALHQQLLSSHPGDATARIWGLLVFQYWWKKYMAN
jgi:asparagine synthase (glutamine-hydrolysing)